MTKFFGSLIVLAALALPGLARGVVAGRGPLPHRPGLAARGGGDDAAVVAEAVADVESPGDAVATGQRYR